MLRALLLLSITACSAHHGDPGDPIDIPDAPNIGDAPWCEPMEVYTPRMGLTYTEDITAFVRMWTDLDYLVNPVALDDIGTHYNPIDPPRKVVDEDVPGVEWRFHLEAPFDPSTSMRYTISFNNPVPSCSPVTTTFFVRKAGS